MLDNPIKLIENYQIIKMVKEEKFKNPIIFRSFIEGKKNKDLINLLVEDNDNEKEIAPSYRRISLKKKIEKLTNLKIHVLTTDQIDPFYLSKLNKENSISLEEIENKKQYSNFWSNNALSHTKNLDAEIDIRDVFSKEFLNEIPNYSKEKKELIINKIMILMNVDIQTENKHKI